MLCYGKRSITHENTTKIDQHFPRSISSIDFTCEIIHVRAEGAVLGSTDGRRSGRAVEAARDVGGGRHVEDISDSTGKSAAQRRVDGLHRRAFGAVGSGGQVQQRRQDGAGGRDGQVKDEVQRRSAQIVVELRLADETDRT